MRKIISAILLSVMFSSLASAGWWGPKGWSKPAEVSKPAEKTVGTLGASYQTLQKDLSNNVCNQVVVFSNPSNSYVGVMAQTNVSFTNIMSSVTPAADDTFNLGDASRRWHDIYAHDMHIDGMTLYIGGVPLSSSNGVLSFGGQSVGSTNVGTNFGAEFNAIGSLSSQVVFGVYAKHTPVSPPLDIVSPALSQMPVYQYTYLPTSTEFGVSFGASVPKKSLWSRVFGSSEKKEVKSQVQPIAPKGSKPIVVAQASKPIIALVQSHKSKQKFVEPKLESPYVPANWPLVGHPEAWANGGEGLTADQRRLYPNYDRYVASAQTDALRSLLDDVVQTSTNSIFSLSNLVENVDNVYSNIDNIYDEIDELKRSRSNTTETINICTTNWIYLTNDQSRIVTFTTNEIHKQYVYTTNIVNTMISNSITSVSNSIISFVTSNYVSTTFLTNNYLTTDYITNHFTSTDYLTNHYDDHTYTTSHYFDITYVTNKYKTWDDTTNFLENLITLQYVCDNGDIATNGTRKVILVDGSSAGYFESGGGVGDGKATLGNVSQAVLGTRGSFGAALADATSAFYGYLTGSSDHYVRLVATNEMVYATDNVRAAMLVDSDRAAAFEDATNAVELCNGVEALRASRLSKIAKLGTDIEAGYFESGSNVVRLAEGSIAGNFFDGVRLVDIANGSLAGHFVNGSKIADFGGPTKAGYFTDGTRIVDLSDGVEAGRFVNGSNTVTLSSAARAGYFTDEVRAVEIANGTQAGHFVNASRTADLADGSQAGHFVNGSYSADLCRVGDAGYFSGVGGTATLGDALYGVNATHINGTGYYVSGVAGVDGQGHAKGILTDLAAANASVTSIVNTIVSGVYSLVGHTHAHGDLTGVTADQHHPQVHDHDLVYAPIVHNHDGTYIKIGDFIDGPVSPGSLTFGNAALGWNVGDYNSIEARVGNSFKVLKGTNAAGGNLLVETKLNVGTNPTDVVIEGSGSISNYTKIHGRSAVGIYIDATGDLYSSTYGNVLSWQTAQLRNNGTPMFQWSQPSTLEVLKHLTLRNEGSYNSEIFVMGNSGSHRVVASNALVYSQGNVVLTNESDTIQNVLSRGSNSTVMLYINGCPVLTNAPAQTPPTNWSSYAALGNINAGQFGVSNCSSIEATTGTFTVLTMGGVPVLTNVSYVGQAGTSYYATVAGSASSASIAATSTNALQLGGIAAASYLTNAPSPSNWSSFAALSLVDFGGNTLTNFSRLYGSGGYIDPAGPFVSAVYGATFNWETAQLLQSGTPVMQWAHGTLPAPLEFFTDAVLVNFGGYSSRLITQIPSGAFYTTVDSNGIVYSGGNVVLTNVSSVAYANIAGIASNVTSSVTNAFDSRYLGIGSNATSASYAAIAGTATNANHATLADTAASATNETLATVMNRGNVAPKNINLGGFAVTNCTGAFFGTEGPPLYGIGFLPAGGMLYGAWSSDASFGITDNLNLGVAGLSDITRVRKIYGSALSGYSNEIGMVDGTFVGPWVFSSPNKAIMQYDGAANQLIASNGYLYSHGVAVLTNDSDTLQVVMNRGNTATNVSSLTFNSSSVATNLDKLFVSEIHGNGTANLISLTSKVLTDGSQNSLNWNSRLLYNSSGTQVASWGTDVEIQTNLVVSGTATVGGSILFAPSYVGGWTTAGSLTLTSQNVYYAWTNWTAGETSSGIGWTNNGVYVKTASAAGLYSIMGNISVSQNQNTETLELEVFNGTVSGGATNSNEKLSGRAYMATANEIYSIPVGGFIRLALNDYLEVKFKNTSGAGRVVDATNGIINFRMIKVDN